MRTEIPAVAAKGVAQQPEIRPVRIEQWAIVDRQPDTFMRLPEKVVQCLAGRVYGHPRQPDGKLIETSPIVRKCGEYVLTLSGTAYELGEPDAHYAAVFDNARARLLGSLLEVKP